MKNNKVVDLAQVRTPSVSVYTKVKIQPGLEVDPTYPLCSKLYIILAKYNATRVDPMSG